MTWITTNLAPDTKRAVGQPFAYSLANLSNLVSGQLYPSNQGPRYVQGNAISAGLTIVAGFLYASCWFLLRRRNLKKSKLIDGGATTNGKEGDQALEETEAGLRVARVSVEDFEAMVADGRVRDAATVAAWHLATRP